MNCGLHMVIIQKNLIHITHLLMKEGISRLRNDEWTNIPYE